MENDVSRRDFIVKTSLAGFALATLPISSFAITTSQEGLVCNDIQIPVKNETIPGYISYPKKEGKYPVILVIHEIFGIHEHIRDVCRRFANLGFVAIAPDLFHRQGNVKNLKEINDILKIVGKAPTSQVIEDCDATIAYLNNIKNADLSKLNVTGFCWGGRTTWLYCAHNAKIKAGIAWYGPLIGSDELHPKAPVDIVNDLKVPVLGLYASLDKHITKENIEKMQNLLKEKNSKSKIVVFDNVNHGFFADYRPMYNETSAKKGLEMLITWIKENNGM